MGANPPRVSVVTTVYNGERFLAEAIESILDQSFRDFEYILVDDASTDASPAIIETYARLDPRIRVIHNQLNLNPCGSINRALEVAVGEYFANLDQDDFADRRRLELQIAFLDKHPEIGVVGAQARQIDHAGSARHTMSYPTSPAMARWVILFGTPVLHSAATIRRELLLQVGGYSGHGKYAIDYALWAALVECTKITNLPETLVSYRRHADQASSVASASQQGEVWLLIYRMLAERLTLRIPLNDIGLLFHGVRRMKLEDATALERAAALLSAIHRRYLEKEQPDPKVTEQIDEDYALRLLAMAWTHRNSQRVASRNLLCNALDTDPLLWKRPNTCAQLRKWRQGRQSGT